MPHIYRSTELLPQITAQAEHSQDKFELRVHSWDCLSRPLQSQLLQAGVVIQVDPILPSWLTLCINLTQRDALTERSTLNELALCFMLCDLRRPPKCESNQHSSLWYMGMQCTKCGDVD